MRETNTGEAEKEKKKQPDGKDESLLPAAVT